LTGQARRAAILLVSGLIVVIGAHADDTPLAGAGKEGQTRRSLQGLNLSSEAPTIARFGFNQFSGPLDILRGQHGIPAIPPIKTWPQLNVFPKSTHDIFLSTSNAISMDSPHSDSFPTITTRTSRSEFKPRDWRVRWEVANRESLLFTGIMHTYNLATEAGTRDALNGHWLQDYLDSVRELRGWSDGDKFMSPYVGHTIEGSVFGYIERQNDPKYRDVQWGDGRDYFISVLHSLAYSAVWHTQWKIGPISEASIGNVMLHTSPGFVTLTDTPTLGACAMIAEDAADRYLIMGLENRTANPFLIMLARSFLSPGRAFANLMSFKVPWHRETRMGLFGENYRIRQELVTQFKEGTGEKPFEFVRRSARENELTSASHPSEAPIELMAFPYYEGFVKGGTCVGGGGSGAVRISPTLQVVAELSGCLVMHMPAANQSGDSLFYAGGLRWSPRAAHRFSPYVQVLFGGKRVTHEIVNLALRRMLLQEWNDGNGTLPHYPMRSDWSVEVSNNGPSVAVGGGLDVVVARPFAWRVINLEYAHTWMPSVDMINPQNSIRVSTGAILRIGTW